MDPWLVSVLIDIAPVIIAVVLIVIINEEYQSKEQNFLARHKHMLNCMIKSEMCNIMNEIKEIESGPVECDRCGRCYPESLPEFCEGCGAKLAGG